MSSSSFSMKQLHFKLWKCLMTCVFSDLAFSPTWGGLIALRLIDHTKNRLYRMFFIVFSALYAAMGGKEVSKKKN